MVMIHEDCSDRRTIFHRFTGVNDIDPLVFVLTVSL